MHLSELELCFDEGDQCGEKGIGENSENKRAEGVGKEGGEVGEQRA